MTGGYILLIAVGILILFGVAQRVLDQLKLSDTAAILFAAGIFIGGLIPDIPITSLFSVNIGGALIPLGLCAYLLIRAERTIEWVRALVAAAVTGTAVYFIGRYFPAEAENMPFDVNYLYGISAGVIAYILGRSRRGAFVAGVLGVIGADIAVGVNNWSRGIAQPVHLGGAGALDVVVLAGLTGVMLSELIGEIIKRVSGTTEVNRDRLIKVEDGGREE